MSKANERHIPTGDDFCRSLLDSAHDLILSVDTSFHISVANRAVSSKLGYSQRELQDKSILDIVHASSSQMVVSIFRRVLGGERVGPFEVVLVHGDGTENTCEGTAAPWISGDSTVGVHAFFRDIEGVKRLEHQLYRAQRLESLGTLAGGIAHDINNVLAPIIVGAELIRERIDDDICLRLLKNIESSTERGARVVRQISAFAGRSEGELIEVNPKYVVRDVIGFIQETFRPPVEIHLDIDRDVWSVIADITQLNQMLMTLAVNARDALPEEGGLITFTVRNDELEESVAREIRTDLLPGRYVRITVNDTGSGIPDHYLSQIFDPFFSTKERTSGTGLGLSTLHSILLAHAGAVTVETELGVGTTFSIYLPVAEEEEEEDMRDVLPATESVVKEGTTRVLLVDDEATIRDNISILLQSRGYDVVTAENGAEAVRIFESERCSIHLVITDAYMPTMDGPTAIRLIRELEPAIPIILISGSDALNNKAESNLPEDVVCLGKPFSSGRLMKLIEDRISV